MKHIIMMWNNVEDFERSKEILSVLPDDLHIGTPNVADDGRCAIGHCFNSAQIIYVHNLLADNGIDSSFANELPDGWNLFNVEEID